MQNNLISLAERLRRNMEQERRNTEALMQENFSTLSRSLQQSSQNALRTTQDAILQTITQIETNVSTRCHGLRALLSRQLRMALGWSLGLVLVTALTIAGLVSLSMLYMQRLQGEIAQLTEQREVLEANCIRILQKFKGLEPYSAEGQDYLLTPPGWTIVQAGTLEQTRPEFRFFDETCSITREHPQSIFTLLSKK